MTKEYTWAKALNISNEQIELWTSTLPEGFDLLYWLLKEKYLSEKDYLNWATNSLKLPLLKSNFYDIYKNQNLPAYLKSLNFWSNYICPISEWDGNVFVACLYPPESLSNEKNIIFILSPIKLIDQIWLHFKNTDLHKEFQEIPPTPDKQIQTDFTEPEKKVELQLVKSENIQNAPEGLDLTFRGNAPVPADLDPGEALFSNPTKADPLPEPHGILLKLDKKPTSNLPDGLSIEKSYDKNNHREEDSNISKNNTPKAEVNLKSKSNPLPPPKRIKEAITPEIYSGPNEIEDCKNFEEVIEWSFHKAKKKYKACMLFQFEKGKPKAWKWDSQWTDSGQSTKTYSLKEPSVFRIISQTKKAFHGGIRPSPINEEFFKDWGYTDLPEIVTAVPIKKYKKISAILLCVGDKSTSNMDSLKLILDLGEKISSYLKTTQRHAS